MLAATVSPPMPFPDTTDSPPLTADAPPALVTVGERIVRRVRYSRADIAGFAAQTLDRNPVHHSAEAARQAGHADVIASGQQTSALMTGLAASHFSRHDDGRAREMLCLNFNFAYREPIPAERELELVWEVAATEWSESLGGVVAQLDGHALLGERAAVVARGTVLVRRALHLMDVAAA
jgi:acyl dehydratase